MHPPERCSVDELANLKVASSYTNLLPNHSTNERYIAIETARREPKAGRAWYM